MRVVGVEFLKNSRKRSKLETAHNACCSTGGTFSTSHITREPRLTVHRGLQVTRREGTSKSDCLIARGDFASKTNWAQMYDLDGKIFIARVFTDGFQF